MGKTRRFTSFEARSGDELLKAWWLSSPTLGSTEPCRSFRCEFCRTESPVSEQEDLREGLRCRSCGLSARLRATAEVLRSECDLGGEIYVTEQATPFFVWLQRSGLSVVGSELVPEERRIALAQHLRQLGGSGSIAFQDVTKLSWNSNRFSSVVCCDVLEHVPDYHRALAEFARVLAPGGKLVATFPFTDGAGTVVRARIERGEIIHVLPPEYHGDPLSGGILCYYHFGWDILDAVRAAGFAKAEMIMPWAPDAGIYYGNWTLVAQR